MTAHDHRTLFLEITPERREAIKRLIEDLIDLTDLVDGDTEAEDAEDADAEPSLGWTEHGPSASPYGHDDRELEDEHGGDILDEPHDELDEGDLEPSGEENDGGFIWGGGEDGAKLYAIRGHEWENAE